MEKAKRIVVTGADGFVGRWMRATLENRNASGEHELFFLGHGAADTTKVEITDARQTAELIRDVMPTAVIHLAAVASPSVAQKEPGIAWKVNLEGTMNVAQAILEHAPEARLIHAGSSEIYGATFNDGDEPRAADENAVLRPMSVYGATKAAADIYLGQQAFARLRSVRFRPFNHTGPWQSDAYVVPTFARQVAEIAAGLRKPVIEVGNLDARRDFLHVLDVTRAYADAALSDDASIEGRAYNLCSGVPTRIGAILDKLVALAGIDVEIRQDAARMRPSDVPSAFGSFVLVREKLGWQPMIGLDDLLTDVLDHWRNRVAGSLAAD